MHLSIIVSLVDIIIASTINLYLALSSTYFFYLKVCIFYLYGGQYSLVRLSGN